MIVIGIVGLKISYGITCSLICFVRLSSASQLIADVTNSNAMTLNQARQTQQNSGGGLQG